MDDDRDEELEPDFNLNKKKVKDPLDDLLDDVEPLDLDHPVDPLAIEDESLDEIAEKELDEEDSFDDEEEEEKASW